MKVPIFPLSGVIFFPETDLPLNIFEERYLDMIDYSLSNNRLVAMIQPLENNQYYKIGCLGKINSFNETNDKRYIINIRGISLFNLKKEVIENTKFKIFEISLLENYSSSAPFSEDKFNKKILLDRFKIFCEKNNISINFEIIDSIDSINLIKLIAMSCPFSAAEKQMLLETKNINDMPDKIISLFEFYTNNNFLKGTVN
tara:strand:- start:901 stop:1500 length:600 start_codon:yes stop_codon:yes gene_type:complete